MALLVRLSGSPVVVAGKCVAQSRTVRSRHMNDMNNMNKQDGFERKVGLAFIGAMLVATL